MKALLLPVGKAPLRPVGTTSSASRRRRIPALFAAVFGVLLLGGCSSDDVDAWKRGALPEGMTNHTDRVTTLWQGAWVAALLVGALVWALIFWAVVVFRRRPGDTGLPPQVRYNLPVEVTFTAVPLIMVLVFFFFTARDEEEILAVSSSPDTCVNVVGKQWSWNFNYLSPDCATAEVYEAGTPALPPTLYLPLGQSVTFVLTSNDVNHSFFVPAMQFKMDLIAGRTNEFQVTPTRLGTFRGKCAELCGQDHSRMLFNVTVVTPQEYQAHREELRAAGNVGGLPASLGNGPQGSVPQEPEEAR